MIAPSQTLRFYRGKLPHWLVADRPYFVTMCRAGSLPTNVALTARDLPESRTAPQEGGRYEPATANVALTARDLPESRNIPGREGVTSPPINFPENKWLDEFNRIDTILDAASGCAANLTTPPVANLIFTNLAWLRERGWHIWAACIMPSHLHLVMASESARTADLIQDLGQFKNYTARLANPSSPVGRLLRL